MTISKPEEISAVKAGRCIVLNWTTDFQLQCLATALERIMANHDNELERLDVLDKADGGTRGLDYQNSCDEWHMCHNLLCDLGVPGYEMD